MYEGIRYIRAVEIVRALRDCYFEILYSKFLEEELLKKEKELKIPALSLLQNIEKLGKAHRIKVGSKKAVEVATELVKECRKLHFEDALHLAVCKLEKIPFVSFDTETLEAAEELEVEAISAYELYFS